MGVTFVQHEGGDEVGVAAGYRQRRRLLPELPEELGRGPFDGLTGHDGRHGHHGLAQVPEPSAHVAHGQDGLDAHEGVRGTDDHGVCRLEGLEHLGRWASLLGTGKAHLPHHRLPPPAHEVVLKVQLPLVGDHARAHRRIGDGQEAGLHPQGVGQPRGDLGEPEALAQPGGAQHVGGQVAVAQPEPGLLSVAGQHLQGGEGVARHAPAGLRVGDARQGVHQGVQVGADGEPPQLEVVAHVADHRQAAAQELLEPLGQLRATHAPRQGHHLHVRHSVTSSTALRGRSRPPSAGQPKVMSAWGSQSAGRSSTRFTVSGQKMGAQSQQAPSPTA